MKRREFITLLGGAAAAWPLAARAQQEPERMRRIGVLMNFAADDPEGQSRLAAFLQGLQEFGWAVGRNLRIDTRWHGGDAERYGQYAAELVLRPVDVRNPAEMERALASFVRGTQDGLIATGGGIALQRKLIIDFAARHRLPAVYPYRYFVTDGGLISYGPDLVNQCREAASYMDRILKGEKPSDLPFKRRPSTVW